MARLFYEKNCGFSGIKEASIKKALNIAAKDFLFERVDDGARTHDPRHHKPIL